MSFSKPGSSPRPRKPKQEVVNPGRPVPVNTGPILDQESPLLYNELVMVGAPACDWLTLTTFNPKVHVDMMAYTITADTVRRYPIAERSRMQYRGFAGDGWFVGEGRQDGLPHYMMQASGARAQDALRFALMFHEGAQDIKCTRIDLQCTSTTTFADDLPAVAVALRGLPSSEWAGRGPRPKVTYFSSEDGRDTLYVGARTSPRFWRFYNKEINGDLRLRAELEAKGWLSQVIWERLAEEGVFHVKHQFDREFGALPTVLREVARETWEAWFAEERHARPVVARDAEIATQRWLMEVVLPCLEKHLETESGYEVRLAYARSLGFDK